MLSEWGSYKFKISSWTPVIELFWLTLSFEGQLDKSLTVYICTVQRLIMATEECPMLYALSWTICQTLNVQETFLTAGPLGVNHALSGPHLVGLFFYRAICIDVYLDSCSLLPHCIQRFQLCHCVSELVWQSESK